MADRFDEVWFEEMLTRMEGIEERQRAKEVPLYVVYVVIGMGVVLWGATVVAGYTMGIGKGEARMVAKVERAAMADLEAKLGKPAVVLVQKGLTRLGFRPGPADGTIGRTTRNAIRHFQKQLGAWPSGYLTTSQAEILIQMGYDPPPAK